MKHRFCACEVNKFEVFVFQIRKSLFYSVNVDKIFCIFFVGKIYIAMLTFQITGFYAHLNKQRVKRHQLALWWSQYIHSQSFLYSEIFYSFANDIKITQVFIFFLNKYWNNYPNGYGLLYLRRMKSGGFVHLWNLISDNLIERGGYGKNFREQKGEKKYRINNGWCNYGGERISETCARNERLRANQTSIKQKQNIFTGRIGLRIILS